MGHKVGWLTLYAGIASGADVILIPEIPYDIEKVCEAINRRKERGSGFTILAVAEGAIAKEDAALPKKELKKRQEEIAKKYPSVSYKIAEEIEAKTGMEIRVTVPGHMQRGGSPCPYDRVLSTRLGSEAAQLILDKQYGYMVGMVNGKVKKIPLGECAGKLKTVDPNAQEVLQAKRMGISFAIDAFRKRTEKERGLKARRTRSPFFCCTAVQRNCRRQASMPMHKRRKIL